MLPSLKFTVLAESTRRVLESQGMPEAAKKVQVVVLHAGEHDPEWLELTLLELRDAARHINWSPDQRRLYVDYTLGTMHW